MTHGTGIDTGIGFAVTADQHPSSLSADYGNGTPLSFQIYLRLRPSRMKNSSMANMDMPAEAPAEASSGEVTLTLTVTGPDGKPLTGAAVTASVAITSMDMGTTHPAFKDAGNGHYTSEVSFAMAGPWRVSIKVTPPGGTGSAKTLDYSVAP